MKHLNKHQCEKIKLKMMENILERNDMEGAGLLTYTASDLYCDQPPGGDPGSEQDVYPLELNVQRLRDVFHFFDQIKRREILRLYYFTLFRFLLIGAAGNRPHRPSSPVTGCISVGGSRGSRRADAGAATLSILLLYGGVPPPPEVT